MSEKVPNEFVVYDTWKERFVANIDMQDGSVTHVADPNDARIFRGVTWWDEWQDDRWERMTFAEADGRFQNRSED